MRSLPRPSPLRALAVALLIFAAHNAYTQPWTLDDAFITGPTGTNVNDFRALAFL